MSNRREAEQAMSRAPAMEMVLTSGGYWSRLVRAETASRHVDENICACIPPSGWYSVAINDHRGREPVSSIYRGGKG